MIVDFEKARRRAFDHISKTNTARILNASEQKELQLVKYIEVWDTKAEIFLTDNSVREIRLFVCFPDDFPLIIPRIYLSPEDNAWIRYIPHVNVKGYVCSFDEEAISLHADQPGNIVKATLLKVLQIIEDGICKRNVNDFEDEFIAYWDETYEKEKEVITGISMIDNKSLPETNTIKLLSLKKSYSRYSIIIHDEGNDFLQFKSFLKLKGYSFDELDAFYLGEINSLYPPFDAINSTVFEIVKNHFPLLVSKLKKFINFAAYPKFILFSLLVKEQRLIFGWRIFRLNTNRNGFRPTALSPMDVYTSFQKSDPVQRMKFDVFTKERLRKRTEGISKVNSQLKISIAGLGSIGSNLLNSLLPLEIDELVIIDPDDLTIENTQRHLLGMDFIGNHKVDSIKKYLEDKNPLLKITTFQKSVIQVIVEKADLLNNTDYIFVAIGKNNIEEYIFDELNSGALKKPVFFLWVEPYLCGAHCLLIQPGHKLSFQDLYHEGFFKYNIIDESEYKDDSRQLQFREAGCQASYLPYGQKNIILFLSALTPVLYNIIDTKETKSLRISWRGNPEMQKELNLRLSILGAQMQNGVIQINEI